MAENQEQPKRLIEVDLPIRTISNNARYENSLRHGRISNLHLWWARRPTVACRAVILAANLPDPMDPRCPERFRKLAADTLTALRERRGGQSRDLANPSELRLALLNFVGEMSAWDIPLSKDMWTAARTLIRHAHETLGGSSGTRPLCADPFAGGGSIPIEALRLGMDAFASDSNQVAVLLNKAALELLPKYGSGLVDAVETWGRWVLAAARDRLTTFYPQDPDGSTPIAYLWARTIRCEGPGCGAEIPLLRSLCIAKKKSRSVCLRIVARSNPNRIEFEIDTGTASNTAAQGTVRSGSVTCPIPHCGFTTRIKAVREQLKWKQGGTADARLICVVTVHPTRDGRSYRLPNLRDLEAVKSASAAFEERRAQDSVDHSFVPNEAISTNELRRIAPPLYGMTTWGHLFTPRQSLALGTFCELIHEARRECAKARDEAFSDAVQVFLALTLSRLVDLSNALTRWKADAECPVQLISRQAIPFVWDFAEASIVADSSGSWASAVDRTAHVIRSVQLSSLGSATVARSNAQKHPLPNGSVHTLITDPPYYDSVPYAHLSDFFFVWLKRSLPKQYSDLFRGVATEKEQEIVVDRPHRLSTSKKDVAFYESNLRRAFEEGSRILAPGGIGVVVFASKTTESWEAILRALIDAGWVISGSWPIDTEMETRASAQGQARLGSSIHLVCRPRTALEVGSSRSDPVGDWRDVLAELPIRMHEWLPRLDREGIVGADAIFSCLGPALEIFSRYPRVEKVSGERVELAEYLEHVWAAVSREALAMVFRDAETTGLEEDARLSAMWLWTLAGPSSTADSRSDDVGGEPEADSDSDDEESLGNSSTAGFALEYDAARKIAQGLGARLEELGHVVEINGDEARLLTVAERAKHLFGKPENVPTAKKSAKRKQMSLLADLDEAAEAQGWGETGAPKAGTTTLDRIHQAMVLFGAGRGEALKRFLVEEGVGKQSQFWKLAQSMSALYPNGTDEKRWVDGVLARKKGLGF